MYVVLINNQLKTMLYYGVPLFYNSMKPSLDHMSFHRDFSHGNRNKLDRLRTEALARPFSSAWPKSWRGSSRVEPVPRQQSPPARSNLAETRLGNVGPLGPRKFLVLGSEMLVKCWLMLAHPTSPTRDIHHKSNHYLSKPR